jgi:heat-inducible transcriptional repressor
MAALTARSRKILFALVTEYISTGEPVGSRTMSRKYGLDLSPATIRNVLADLEEAGLLHQPHTSAGRVPTDRALRLFIEALTEFQEIPHATKLQMRDRLRVIFDESEVSHDDALRQAGRFLSELAGAAAVIAPSPADTKKLLQLRFIEIKADQLLAVLVFADGFVENRYLRHETPIAREDLERVHNLLNDVVEGRTLGDLRTLLARRLDDERSELDRLRRQAFDLAHQAVSDLTRSGDDVMIEGRARLMDLPEYTDADRLKRLVRALEDREHLVGMLDRTIEAGVVTVFIGNEAGELADADLSLVVAPFGAEDHSGGTVGVLGPTRMDYTRMLPLVDAAAAALTAAMRKGK